MRRRQCQRFTKRLEVTFASAGSKYRGITSDLSAGGIFIRTQNGLNPGTVIDIEIYLPETKVAVVKGIVRRTVKTPLAMVKNGMGVELIERDQNFLEFLRNFDYEAKSEVAGDDEPSAGGSAAERGQQETDGTAHLIPESAIISCEACGVKNKVPRERLQFSPKCGKCGAPLKTEDFV